MYKRTEHARAHTQTFMAAVAGATGAADTDTKLERAADVLMDAFAAFVVAGDDGKHAAAAQALLRRVTANTAMRERLRRIDRVEGFARLLQDACHAQHLALRAAELPGMQLTDLIGAPRLLEALRGPAGGMLIDLNRGQDKDAFGKMLACLAFRRLVADRRHTNAPGQALGDGGDGTLLLPGRGGGTRPVAVEVKTVVPEGGRTGSGAPRPLPPATGAEAGTGQWRVHIAHSAHPDLLYVVVAFRVRQLPRSACTLVDALRRTVGWLLAIDNAESFAAMRAWTGKGPVLNPRRWQALPATAPPFRAKGPTQQVIERPPTRLCVWVPTLVDAARREDPLAYWEALDGAGDRGVGALAPPPPPQ
jgi:hypothetical protein